ncbi:hypothetical protein, partial [Terribacillus saccharophilus]|uniref:hypothetical protein n=1 Tax=Terribacillus saccharophilus TaxID=361277 RepID=UPI002DD2D34A|nr:hypothetical protein [Terribacillus saccharophilus]
IQLRLRRGFEGIYEKELIELHKRVEKELSFTIFLQQSDRGSTQFRANTRKLSGQALSLKEAGDFIKLMWENGDIYNVGLIHSENEKEHAYIIKKEKNYFYLKKYTSSVTEREVVKNVLRKLNNYKPQSETSADTQETEEPRH